MIHFLPFFITLFLYSSADKLPDDHYKCRIVYKAEEDGKQRIDLEPALIFKYTDPQIKRHLKGRDYIMAEVALSGSKKKTFLVLKLDIGSLYAHKSFGVIGRNSPIRITTIRGEHVFIDPIRMTKGDVDEDGGRTLYTFIGLLDKSDMRTLKKCEIDKLGIVWEMGFEEYDIFNVDILIDQIKCLKKNL